MPSQKSHLEVILMENLNQEVVEVVEVSETVKEIPGFSKYLCDIEKGEIWRKPTDRLKGKWLNPQPNHIGYVMTSLINDEGELIKGVLVHEIVISAAIEFPKEWWNSKNLEIDHRDRKKWNNKFSNLQLVTKKKNHENIEDRKPRVRLTKEDVNYIMDSFKAWNGRKVQFYKTMSEEIGCVWQTVQYTVLGYVNNSKRD